MDIEEMYEKVKEFILNYTEDGKKKYIIRIKDSLNNNKKSFVLDFKDVVIAYPELADEIIEDYERFEEIVQDAIRDIFNELFEIRVDKMKVRVRGLPEMLEIRDIKGEKVNKLVQIEAMVNSVSDPVLFPELEVYVCKDCGERVKVINSPVDLERFRVTKCPSCGSKNIRFSPEKSRFINVKEVEVQEIPERVKSDSVETMTVIVTEEIGEEINPGDRVIITGVVKPRKTGNNNYYRRVLLASDINTLNRKAIDIEITKEEEKKIREIASDENVVERIVESIAPSIKGNEDVKFALAISLFSGGQIRTPEGMTVRGESHVLIVGDPGTAKSQLKEFLKLVIPRGVTTTATTSTSVGLTATATKDNLTGKWTVKAGALVKSDEGFIVIDELNALSNKDLLALREAMAQGTVSVAKANVTVTLPARVTVIGIMNPKYGRWNLNERLFDQINLDSPLLSRFDLIIPVIDKPDEQRDYEVAKHILNFMIRNKVTVKNYIEPELLKKYISYARQNYDPKLTDEVVEYIANYYTKMRKKSRIVDGFIETPIGARQLMAFFRMARAIARMKLKDEITIDDAKIVIEFWEKTLRKLFIDDIENDESIVDINNLEIGVSSKKLSKIETILNIIKNLDTGDGVTMSEILEVAWQKGISKKEAKEIVKKLYDSGEIYQPSYGKYSVSD